jgi:hypothetical protein
MELIKAITFSAILTAAIAMVLGSQGTSAGALAVHGVQIAEAKLYWSWPIFLSGTGLAWGLMLLQR